MSSPICLQQGIGFWLPLSVSWGSLSVCFSMLYLLDTLKTNDASPQLYPSNLGMERDWCQRSMLPTNAKGVLERDLTAFCHRAAVHCRLLALTSPPSITMRQFCVRASSCPLETTLNEKGLNFRSSTRQRTEMKPMHVSRGKNWSRLWIFYREVGIKDALVSFANTCILPNDTQHVYWAVRS